MPLQSSNESKTATINGQLKAAELSNWLESVPPNADIRINTHRGDRNEGDYHTVTATWRAHV